MGKLSRKGVITDVVFEKETLPPIIVNFENGNVDPGDIDTLNFNVHRGRVTKERMVSTTCDNIAYKGLCRSGQLRTFLAIRNKATNEVKLVEASTCTLTPLFEHKESVKLDMSANEIRGELAKAYGTKARRLKAILAETLKVDSDEVQLAASNVKITEEYLNKVKVETIFDVLPPHNRDVKVVEDVYKMEDILVQEILNCFDGEVQRIMNTSFEDLKSEKFSEFFFGSWGVLQHRSDINKKIICLKALLLIECLGNVLRATPFALRKEEFSVCYFSETLNKYILNLFTCNSLTGRSCSRAQQDKGICYVLVLCLLIFDYKIDLSAIIKLTKSSMTRLSQLSRVAGATVSKEHVAHLRMPLLAPPIARKMKRKT